MYFSFSCKIKEASFRWPLGVVFGSYEGLQVPPVVQYAPDFHHVVDYDIEDDVVAHIDAVVWVFAFLSRSVWLKCLGAGGAFLDGAFDVVHERGRGDGVLKL